MRVQDLYDSMAEFEEILEDARMAASTDKEEAFVAQMKQSYGTYGGRAFLSELQDRWLRSIAGSDD